MQEIFRRFLDPLQTFFKQLSENFQKVKSVFKPISDNVKKIYRKISDNFQEFLRLYYI